MKHFMQPRSTILREAHTNNDQFSVSNGKSKASPSPSPARRHNNKGSKENAPPDLNMMISDQKPSHSPASSKLKSPLPPRPPPSSNPLKRKLFMDTVPENSVLDSGVKVVVRMRPVSKGEEEGEMIVQKLSNDSLSINGHTFTFDSVADMQSTQLDIFHLVGAPLVENCLAGFNSSVFAYGQTGSGKTYTMWGPANALLDENLSSDQQGLTPRVFQRLFARINEEQVKHADKDKQLTYQCRCSFLEIYNEQITDLLDPTQRNLQIREDVKSGVYVENLREEYVFTMNDVTQLLIKGFSNRRTGATSINAESSRSHSVFTCVVECRCKSKADGISSLKTSRINLVDLAGSERQKSTGAAGERLKEAGNINRSLSQLGNLINILAEVSQTGKQRHIPYRDSRLTFLLQESLGGNAKLAMICAVSPAQSCKSETFSTLRFAQRAKSIKNKAVVNEEMENDVNHLREVIRQLRDELHRVKANSNNSTGWDTRKSLNILKSLINPHFRLPQVDEDGDEEMEIDEEAVENLCVQDKLEPADTKDQNNYDDRSTQKHSEDTDVDMEEDISEQVENHEIVAVDCADSSTNSKGCSNNDIHHDLGEVKDKELVQLPNDTHDEERNHNSLVGELLTGKSPSKMAEIRTSCALSDSQTGLSTGVVVACGASDSQSDDLDDSSPSNLSIVPCKVSPVLKSPTPSVSPRVNSSRKSLRTSSMLTASQKDSKDESKSNLEEDAFISLVKSRKRSILASQTSQSLLAPSDHLAVSLHRGLEIIDSHRKNSAFRQSSFRFSCKPDFKPIKTVEKVDVGVQTFPQDIGTSDEDPELLLCNNCKRRKVDDKDGDDSANMQLVPIDGPESAEKSKKQLPKAVEKVLAGAIRREMALEEFCAKQTSEIMQLKRLVQQYKHERECNAIIGQTREDKILRLESLMDGVLPTEEFMEEELVALMHEHKLLKEKYENHPDVLRTNIELKTAQEELEHYRNFYDLGEREVLLEEIQDLRNQLQYYVDPSSASALKRKSLLQLTYSCEPSVSPVLSAIPEVTEENAEVKLEQERLRWTEAESEWISLADELKAELDASRTLAEKTRQELETEKRCASELKEAMQMAMEGHARMLEQYADLEEKHIQLLARHRKIQEGIDDVKKAASRAGVRGAESKFINALAAEISAIKVEREKERRYLRDENKALQAQLRDTAEAVQAAGELLVRLKEAEEAVAAAQRRAMDAELETSQAFKQIDKLKKKHEKEIKTLNEQLAVSRLPKEAIRPSYNDCETAKYDTVEPQNEAERWREEFEPFYNNGADGELSKLAEPSSWFSGYDRCNI